MMRHTNRGLVVPVLGAFFAALALLGCGGGGSGTGTAPPPPVGANLVNNSFGTVGSPTNPGPAALTNHPRDAALWFRFSGALSDSNFGGFVLDGTGLPVMKSAPTITGAPLNYFEYVNQTAARQSLQIWRNQSGASIVTSYVVGRLVEDAAVMVIITRVVSPNQWNIPGSAGLQAGDYTYYIPPLNGILVGGAGVASSGPLPSSLPIAVPVPSLNLTEIPQVLRVSALFLPDPVQPQVLSIESADGFAGTSSDPIPCTGALKIFFNKLIDTTSVDPVRNLRILNNDLIGPDGPTFVPGSLTFLDEDGRQVVVFTPTPGYGPGLPQSAPTVGYNIAVRVGVFGDPSVPPIKGLPQYPNGLQLDLANSLSEFLVTAPDFACPGAKTLVETFEDTDFLDLGFQPDMNLAVWSDPTNPDPSKRERLACVPISGTPFYSFNNNPANQGTRVQFTVTPTPLSTLPAGLFSPFDDSVFCLSTGPTIPCVNPQGGSHIMHLYEGADLGGVRNSLELVEWGPVNSVAAGSLYPQYRVWAGQTTIAAAITGGTGNGLSTVYKLNYDGAVLQPRDATAPYPNGTGGVLCGGPATYTIPVTTFATYYPFPVLSPVFDYRGSGTSPSANNLLFEQNIEPGNPATTLANFNRYKATATNPIRRLVGAPLSQQLVLSPNPVATAGGYDIYDMRFTFVAVRSSARSLFYDSGLPDPTYSAIVLNPAPDIQAAGTDALWEFEGADALASPAVPSGPTTGWRLFWSGSPTTGSYNPALPAVLNNWRYVRFRVTLRAENVNNLIQSYSSVIWNIEF